MSDETAMHCKITLGAEQRETLQQLGRRYRATEEEIIQVMVQSELETLEINGETDAFYLDSLRGTWASGKEVSEG